MAKYIMQRILAMLVTLFIIITIGFMVIRLMPGGIFDDAVDMTYEQRTALEAKYNLDKPIPIQYAMFLKGLVLEGDWGTSLKMYVNADAVGAYNILRKYHAVSGEEIDMPVTGLKNPEIIKVAV